MTEETNSVLVETRKDATVTISQSHPKLTLFQTCNILVSSVGGPGIFIAMSTMMDSTGSIGVLLIVILVSGLLNFSLANCFTEVAILLPKAGGPYFFIKQVFGDFFAFLFIWGFLFLIITPVWAADALTSALYIIQLFFPGCRPPVVATKLLSAAILVLVVLINCLYLKYVTKIQAFLSSAKIVVMFILLVMGIIALAQGEGENYESMFEGSASQPGDYAVSILSGMFLFGGWQMVTFLLEEMEAPERNLPKSLSISFFITITLSELIAAAYFVVLTPKEVLNADAVAVLFTDRIYRPLSPVISLFVTATAVGALNGAVLAQSRLVSTTAKQGHMPWLMSMNSTTYNMPWASSVVLCIISLLVLFFVDLSKLIIMTSFFATVMALAVLLCLVALRIRQPNARRPVKVWIFTIVVQLTVTIATISMSIYQQPKQIGTLALFILAGTPVYIVLVKWKSRLKPLNKIMDKLTVFFQKLLLLKQS